MSTELAQKLDAIELDTDAPVAMRTTQHQSGRCYRVEIIRDGYSDTIIFTGDVDAALDVFAAAVAVGHPVLR
jgi:hypothetical protein